MKTEQYWLEIANFPPNIDRAKVREWIKQIQDDALQSQPGSGEYVCRKCGLRKDGVKAPATF